MASSEAPCRLSKLLSMALYSDRASNDGGVIDRAIGGMEEESFAFVGVLMLAYSHHIASTSLHNFCLCGDKGEQGAPPSARGRHEGVCAGRLLPLDEKQGKPCSHMEQDQEVPSQRSSLQQHEQPVPNPKHHAP